MIPKREAPIADTPERQHGRPLKPKTFRFDYAYLAEVDEPDDGSSFWEVRGETDRMHMRAKSFTNRKDADAHLQQLCAAGEIEIEGAGCGEW